MNADSNLEEVRARICETMKKQLHLRIKNAKDVKEFVSFGLFFCKKQIELYSMKFTTAEGYHVYLLETIVLPTFSDTYTSLEETIEVLLSFKVKKRGVNEKPNLLINSYIANDEEFFVE